MLCGDATLSLKTKINLSDFLRVCKKYCLMRVGCSCKAKLVKKKTLCSLSWKGKPVDLYTVTDLCRQWLSLWPRRSWWGALAACPNSQFPALCVGCVVPPPPAIGDVCLEEDDDLALTWCWQNSSPAVCLLHSAIAPLPAPDVWSLNHLNRGQTEQRGPSFLYPFGSTSCKQLGAIYSNSLRWDWQTATKPCVMAALGRGHPPQPNPLGFFFADDSVVFESCPLCLCVWGFFVCLFPSA